MAFLTNFQTFLNFSRKKIAGTLKYFFSKLVYRKGCFGKIKKKFDFSLLIFDPRKIRAASLNYFKYKTWFKFAKNHVTGCLHNIEQLLGGFELMRTDFRQSKSQFLSKTLRFREVVLNWHFLKNKSAHDFINYTVHLQT